MNELQAPVKATRTDHAVFIMVTLLYWITLYIYVPILSPYIESLGATFTFVGIVLGSYGFMQIIIRLPLGILSDRMRVRRPYIMLGMLTGALSCFTFALTEHIGWTLAARAISGISASTWVAFTVLYASYFAKNEATRAMSLISLITVSGQLIGMGLSGYLANGWGWHAAFWAGGFVGVVGFAAAYLIKEPREGVDRTPIQAKDLANVMKESTLLKVSMLSILAHSVLFVTMFGFTPSYAMTLNADKGGLSLLVFAFMIPHALASYYSGKRFAPRLGVWPMIVVGFALSALCTLAIPFMPSLGWLMLTQAFNGFAQGLHLPLLLGLAIQSVDQEKRATAMGFYQAVYAVGMFGGPFLAGWLNQAYGLIGGFSFAFIIALAAAGLSVYWGQLERRNALRRGW
jgi:predicted MFS family arabinose efflux permease